jgi:tape measure domain-containing protein
MPDKELTVVIQAEDKASPELEKLDKNLNKIAGSSDSLEKGLKNVRNGMAIVGAATAAVTFSVVEQAGKFEQYKVALNTMLGSVDKANELFGQLKDFAKVTPFNFEEVVKGSKQLLAMGSSADSIIPELKMLGDVSSGLNVPLEQMVLTFGKVETQGKLTGREVMEFSRAGVPLMQTLADQFGVTKDKITDMVSEGKIGFGDVKKAFETMTGSGGKFFNLMEAQSKTTLGKFSNFQDSVQQLQASIGTLLLPTVKSLIDAVIPLIDKINSFAQANPVLVQTLIAVGLAMGAIAAASFILVPIITTISLLAAGLGITFLAMSGVIGIVVIALAALIAIGLLVAQNWDFIIAKATEMWLSVVTSITSMAVSVQTAFDTMVALVLAKVNEWVTSVKKWVSDMLVNVDKILGLMPGTVEKFFTDAKNKAIDIARSMFGGVAEWVGKIIGLFEQVISKAQDAINKVKEAFNTQTGGGGGGGGGGGAHKHGGIIPGNSNDAVSTVLHGGERVVPRNGVDVNTPSGGGGGFTLNLTIAGDVNSMDTVNTIISQVKEVLNRESELARLGVGT